jgi:hypothetical protein
MKKWLSILLFFINFICVFATSFDEDCNYLGTLFSDVAIDMSLSLEEKNLTPEAVIDEIRTIYNKTASPKIVKKGDIDKKAFASAINDTYAKFSLTNGHASVFDVSSNTFFPIFWHQFVYYSEVYFFKENNAYIVYKDYKNIKKGMHYTGNPENILKTVYDNKILYRYAVFSPTIIKTSNISVGNKEYKVPVAGDVGNIKNRKNYDFKNIDNNIYLKIEKCKYQDKREENQFYNDSKTIIKDFKNAKNIIFDLRTNLGGFNKYLDQFSYALIYDKESKENDIHFSKWSRNLFAGERRINTRTMINKTIAKGLAPSDYISYCLENIEKKYLDDVDDEQVSVTPWYTGKIYILINPLTSSAPENFILSLKKLFGQNVIIIGQNSNGSCDFADVYDYLLPNSKIRIRLTAVDFRKTNLLKENCWHGDTIGIYPDFWCKPQEISSVLSFLIDKEELKNYIE